MAKDVNHAFTGYNAILTRMVNTEMPVKDLAQPCACMVYSEIHTCKYCVTVNSVITHVSM